MPGQRRRTAICRSRSRSRSAPASSRADSSRRRWSDPRWRHHCGRGPPSSAMGSTSTARMFATDRAEALTMPLLDQYRASVSRMNDTPAVMACTARTGAASKARTTAARSRTSPRATTKPPRLGGRCACVVLEGAAIIAINQSADQGGRLCRSAHVSPWAIYWHKSPACARARVMASASGISRPAARAASKRSVPSDVRVGSR